MYKYFVCMRAYHVGNRKAVSLKIFRVVDIELFPNAVNAVLVADTFRDSDDDILVFLYHFL